MLINIIVLILGAGLLSLLLPEDKVSRLWSLMTITVLAYCFYQLHIWNGLIELKEIYPWVRTPSVSIDLEVVLNKGNHYFINGLFLFSLLVVLNNTFYPAETDKKQINGIVLLNIFFIMMLMSSSNYMQFLTAIGVIDVLVFSAINKTEAKKSYIYGNFLADMGILSICAVILGQSGEIGFSYLEDYSKLGQHKDYVAIILLICIFIKSGLFMFHVGLVELSSLLFNRINFIIFGTTPLAGFLALNKLKPLLDISEYSYPILIVFSFASMAWGFIGAISMDNIKQKSIYFALMFWGLMYSFIAFDRHIPANYLAALMIVAYLFNQTLMLVNKASSNEKYVSVMGGFIKNLKVTGIVTLAIIAIYINLLLSMYDEAGWISWLYIALFITASSYVLGQVYLGKSNADERVAAMLKNPSVFLYLPIFFAAVFVGYLIYKPTIYLAALMFVWFLLFILRPFKKLEFLYEKDLVQDLDLIKEGYELLIITPLRVMGRVFWLTIDFVFVEKTIINSINNIINFFIRIFQKIHTDNFYSYIVFTLIGFCVVTLVWWFGGMR